MRPTDNSYRYTRIPLGSFGAIIIIIFVLAVTVSLTHELGNLGVPGWAIAPLAILLPVMSIVLLNHLPSPFKRNRKVVASFTGSGYISWSYDVPDHNGGSLSARERGLGYSWPFIRLLVYQDGLEIRKLGEYFFIPYDKMDVPSIEWISLAKTIVIISYLPDTPARIGFGRFSLEEKLEVIKKHYEQYIS